MDFMDKERSGRACCRLSVGRAWYALPDWRSAWYVNYKCGAARFRATPPRFIPHAALSRAIARLKTDPAPLSPGAPHGALCMGGTGSGAQDAPAFFYAPRHIRSVMHGCITL